MPFWYSERSSLWTTLCTLWRPLFIHKLKDLNFLADIYCYLPHLLWTTVIITSVQGSGKGNVSLVPLYLFTSILTFCLTRHFFSIWLTHSLSISSPSLSLFSPLISLSVSPCRWQFLYIYLNFISTYIPQNHPAESRWDKTIADSEMNKELSVFSTCYKNNRDQLPINKHHSFLEKKSN